MCALLALAESGCFPRDPGDACLSQEMSSGLEVSLGLAGDDGGPGEEDRGQSPIGLGWELGWVAFLLTERLL
jgi:hypothetical protein